MADAGTELVLHGEVGVIAVDAPPVNALSAPVRRGIQAGLAKALDQGARAIVILGRGATFISGADIAELGRPMAAPDIWTLQQAIEECPVPVIAALHGTTLGAGLELALCAHYRLAAADARLGLPEVKLGLVPGAGGTQRLTRAAGPEAALRMAALGEPVDGRAALALGLVDALVQDEAQIEAEAVAFATQLIARGAPRPRLRDRGAPLRGRTALFADFRAANARAFRGFHAPEANVRAIEAAVELGFEAGVAEEARLSDAMLADPQSAAQRHYFFAERAARKVADLPPATAPREIRSVGVVGAGTMGGGIAMAFANAGLPVVLVETAPEALQRGLGVIAANYQRSRGLAPAEIAARLGRISGSLDYADLAQVDLIVEAVFEDMAVKRQVFARLDTVARPGAVLASNTSYLDLDEIAAATARPEDVVGLHFFSPANVMKLLEIVRGRRTAGDVLATALAVGKRLDKAAVVSRVGPGFIANRVAAPRRREAEALLLAGASPADIDRVLYDFGFPMGPFQVFDVVGLDVIKAQPGERSLRAAMVAGGRLGQKGGGGFYDYDAARRPTPSPAAETIIAEFRRSSGVRPRAVSDAEILERSLFSMVNEGAKVLQEGVAARASDIDVAMVAGYGWPVFTGGPMFWADRVGLPAIVARLRALEEALLQQRATEGGRLSEALGSGPRLP
jgi:3-hydroxyacyl-CoA dehydrogenase